MAWDEISKGDAYKVIYGGKVRKNKKRFWTIAEVLASVSNEVNQDALDMIRRKTEELAFGITRDWDAPVGRSYSNVKAGQRPSRESTIEPEFDDEGPTIGWRVTNRKAKAEHPWQEVVDDDPVVVDSPGWSVIPDSSETTALAIRDKEGG